MNIIRDIGVIINFSYLLFETKLPIIFKSKKATITHIMVFVVLIGIISGNILEANRYINPKNIKINDAKILATRNFWGNTLYFPPQEASANGKPRTSIIWNIAKINESKAPTEDAIYNISGFKIYFPVIKKF